MSFLRPALDRPRSLLPSSWLFAFEATTFNTNTWRTASATGAIGPAITRLEISGLPSRPTPPTYQTSTRHWLQRKYRDSSTTKLRNAFVDKYKGVHMKVVISRSRCSVNHLFVAFAETMRQKEEFLSVVQ